MKLNHLLLGAGACAMLLNAWVVAAICFLATSLLYDYVLRSYCEKEKQHKKKEAIQNDIKPTKSW